MNADDLIDRLKALGHPLRLRIIETLHGGERSVTELEHATGIAQPGLSQQLAVIRAAGLVQTRKAAKQVFYRIDYAALAAVRDTFERLASDPSATRASDTKAPHRLPASGAAQFARLS